MDRFIEAYLAISAFLTLFIAFYRQMNGGDYLVALGAGVLYTALLSFIVIAERKNTCSKKILFFSIGTMFSMFLCGFGLMCLPLI